MSGRAETETVSVVIPAYNSAHLLERSIGSVLAQTRPADEILVVNDGSTDNTSEVLARYSGRIGAITQQNGGIARARNAGILAATGDWVAFLDADDQWLPGKLERQLQLAAAQREAGLLFSDALVTGINGEPLGRYLDGKGAVGGWIFDRLLASFFVLPSTIMVRRELLISAGMFTPTLRRTEDYDLCLRLAPLCPFAFLPEPLTLYERQPNSISRNALAEHESHIALFTRLLAGSYQPLSPGQRAIVEARLAGSRFALAYELRSKDPSAALGASWRYLVAHPAQPAAWRLAVGSAAHLARARAR